MEIESCVIDWYITVNLVVLDWILVCKQYIMYFVRQRLCKQSIGILLLCRLYTLYSNDVLPSSVNILEQFCWAVDKAPELFVLVNICRPMSHFTFLGQGICDCDCDTKNENLFCVLSGYGAFDISFSILILNEQ